MYGLCAASLIWMTYGLPGRKLACDKLLTNRVIGRNFLHVVLLILEYKNEHVLWLLALSIFAGCVAVKPTKDLIYPRQLSYDMGVSPEDTFTVIPKPGWRMYPGPYLPLRFGKVIVFGQSDVFYLALNFACDSPDLANFNSPEKMKCFLNKTWSSVFTGSEEKRQGLPMRIRPFAPVGRYGFALRFTDWRYVNITPPIGQWRYLTAGILRLSDDSVLMFDLLTDSVDDAAYHKLLNYITAFAIPESGHYGWKVTDGGAANLIASKAFDKHYPAELLVHQRPYSVVLQETTWLVHGNPWGGNLDDVVEAEIDGETGQVLRITHGKQQ